MWWRREKHWACLMAKKFNQTKLLIASGNSGKVAEIRGLLGDYNVEVVSAKEFDIAEPEETENSFIGNAELKAKYYGDATGLPALADDSGLCVDALGGAPGIYSARWAGVEKNFAKAMQRIEDELGDNDNKKAKFVCALSLYWPEEGVIESFEGKVDGALRFPAAGCGGFGYDPIFVPDGYDRTFSEIEPAAKQRISHRADAFRKLIDGCFT